MKTILSQEQLQITIKRLAHQILENHTDIENLVLMGIQPRGIFLSDRIYEVIKNEICDRKVLYGKLDITFYRDDIRHEIREAKKTDVPFDIENKSVVLIDDVLFTGRTIRAALDALLDLGRPEKVELCVLIDRRLSREIPIRPDYIGKLVDSTSDQKVRVQWKNNDKKDEVYFL